MKYTYFDREEFVRQAADNEDVARQVAQLYHRDIDNDLKGLRDAFEIADFEAVRRRAHKFKSGFIVMGAKALFEQAYALETRSKNGETDLAEAIVQFENDSLGLKAELVNLFNLE